MLSKVALPRESEIKIEMRKASFGGDRSEAGRYAANVRWQRYRGESKGETKGSLPEILQPTWDEKVAKATGRPWAPLLEENYPPELRDAIDRQVSAYGAYYEAERRLNDAEKEGVSVAEKEALREKLQIEYSNLSQQRAIEPLLDEYVKSLKLKINASQQVRTALAFRVKSQIGLNKRLMDGKFDAESGLRTSKPIEEYVDGKDLRVVINTPPDVVSKILSDGRVKSQFETGTSRGMLDFDARKLSETRMFSLHPDMDKENRPIYGHVMENGVDESIRRTASHYGRAVIVLKKDVAERTTFTVGDSLMSGHIPSRITEPRNSSFGAYHDDVAYTEAQIHGQVKVSDIAYIVMPPDSVTPALKSKAEKFGIPIVAQNVIGRFDKFKIEETGDMTKTTGRLIAVRGNELKLFYTHDEIQPLSNAVMRLGFIENELGERLNVNVDSVLRYGYWEEPTSLADVIKASFGGDRSAAGRYAANIRWQGQRVEDPSSSDNLNTLLSQYPKPDDELSEALANAPIAHSGLGKTMREINKEISERESNSERENEMLPAVILSAYLGKGDDDVYVDMNKHFRKGRPLKDFLQEQLTEEEEQKERSLERSIRALEENEDDDTDNSAEIESLREELEEMREKVYGAERFDADDWDYYEHGEKNFDSQYGSFTISINGEDVKMPKVVAYSLMDNAFSEFRMVAPQNFRVYRGIDPATIASLEASVGQTVEDLGFCSTTKYIDTAIGFSGVGVPFQSELSRGYYKEGDTLPPEKRIATILIPKGQKILVPDPSEERMGEGEVILNRGTRFKIVGVNELGPVLEVMADETN